MEENFSNRALANPIANKIRAGDFGPGDAVEVEAKDGVLSITKAAGKRANVSEGEVGA